MGVREKRTAGFMPTARGFEIYLFNSASLDEMLSAQIW